MLIVGSFGHSGSSYMNGHNSMPSAAAAAAALMNPGEFSHLFMSFLQLAGVTLQHR